MIHNVRSEINASNLPSEQGSKTISLSEVKAKVKEYNLAKQDFAKLRKERNRLIVGFVVQNNDSEGAITNLSYELKMSTGNIYHLVNVALGKGGNK